MLPAKGLTESIYRHLLLRKLKYSPRLADFGYWLLNDSIIFCGKVYLLISLSDNLTHKNSLLALGRLIAKTNCGSS